MDWTWRNDWEIIKRQIAYDEYPLTRPTATEMFLRMLLCLYLMFVPIFIMIGILDLIFGRL